MFADNVPQRTERNRKSTFTVKWRTMRFLIQSYSMKNYWNSRELQEDRAQSKIFSFSIIFLSISFLASAHLLIILLRNDNHSSRSNSRLNFFNISTASLVVSNRKLNEILAHRKCVLNVCDLTIEMMWMTTMAAIFMFVLQSKRTISIDVKYSVNFLFAWHSTDVFTYHRV